MIERITAPEIREEDIEYDRSLRPAHLKDMAGQEKVKEKLSIAIEAALKREEALDHVLLYGPPGLGKTTLANIIARELGVDIRTTSGPVLERAADLAGNLTNLNAREVLFIDEIHRMNRVVEEHLYPAIEDFNLDIMVDSGPNARSYRLSLERFTLVGATTRLGLITPPMRSRFGIIERLDFYSPEELKIIVNRSARILEVPLEESGALEIARRSRGTPRIANRLLCRARDYAQIRADGVITLEVADAALRMFDIDEKGLDEMDRRLLLALIDKFDGGPVGIGNLSAVISEEEDTIEEVYEPYLIQEGYLKRTPRGREATSLAYKHLDRIKPLGDGAQGGLF